MYGRTIEKYLTKNYPTCTIITIGIHFLVNNKVSFDYKIKVNNVIYEGVGCFEDDKTIIVIAPTDKDGKYLI